LPSGALRGLLYDFFSRKEGILLQINITTLGYVLKNVLKNVKPFAHMQKVPR
jgi:hypothetical protein